MKKYLLIFFSFLFISCGSNFVWGQTRITDSRYEKDGMFERFTPELEIISKRDLNSKHFQNNDGTSTAIISQAAVHYKKNESAQWEDIRTDIRPNTSEFKTDYPFAVTENKYQLYFSKSLDNGYLIHFPSGDVQLGMKGEIRLLSADNNIIQSIPRNSVNGEIADNTMKFNNTYFSAYDELKVKSMSVDHDIILTQKPAFLNSPNATTVAFREFIKLPDGWKLVYKSAFDCPTCGVPENDKSILVINASGNVMIEFITPIAREQNLHKIEHDDAIKGKYTEEKYEKTTGEFRIVYADGGAYVETCMPVAWLNDANRQYPVIIDPTANCYPTVAVSWTGYSVSSATCYCGWSNCGDEIYWQAGNVAKGWSFFNTSSIPAGSTVSAVTLYYYIFAQNFPYFYIRDNSGNSASSCATLWGQETGGTVYVNFTGTLTTSAYNSNSLGATAASNLQSRLPTGSFGVAFDEYEASTYYAEAYGYYYGTGWAPYVSVTYTTPSTYKSAWVSMNTGSSNWCPGETRNVTVTVTNNGTATWTNVSPDVNIGCKWNADADYFVRVDANGLAPGATNTFTLSMTAPAAGANNLTFDVVKEGDCWFGNNNGSCGPGNSVYTSPAINIDGTAPSHDNLTVNSNCWITDNTQNYTITLVSTESGMGFGGSYGVMALINYQGANAGQYGGYFSWHPTSYVWTLDQVAATGGGFASKNSGYGAGTITLVSCATSLVGNQRTVVFTVRPNSGFPTLTANDISMYTSDACNNQAGWTNYDLNFTSGASALGTVSNAGPIDFCDAGGNFTTAVTVSGNVGSVMWDWGSNNGVWNNNWIAGTTSGVCCFPKQVSTSDGTADRMRYRVTNGSCPTVTSATILIRDRWNEAPTSLTASATPVCSGTSVTLTANFPATINLRGTVDFYSGSCGGTFITSVAGSGGSSVTTNVTPPVGTTTYYARYNPGTGTGCAVSACVSVSVTAAAAPTTATNSSTQSICSTGNAALSGNNPSVGTGVWSVVSGPSTSSAQFANTAVYNTTFTPAGGAGSYVVRWTISNSPCTPSSADATITVSANPVNISIGASPSSTICSGTNVTFTATPTNGGPGPAYQWKLNGGNVGTNSTTYSNSSLVNGDVITCILTSNATCPTGNPATSNSIAMTVNLYSTAPSSATATPSSIPLGNSSTLTLTGGSLGTSASWQWYSSSCGVTSAGSGSSITVSPSSTTTYYVRAEGTCNNTSCVSVTVTVTSFPIGVVNNGVRIYISSGTTVYIDEVSAGNADYINLSNGSSDGRVECQSSTAVIKLEGDWVNDAATGNADATGNNVFYNNGGEVQFIGSAAQTIGGATSTIFSNLKINNTISGNGGVTINTNATVNGLLTLTDGHLISPAAGRLTLGSAATVSPSSAAGAGSASSFISGHLDRVLNATGTNYDFPMGDSPGNTWRPMQLTAKDATARTWSAQFIKTDPISVYGSSITSGESLKGMNNTYYYTVSRTPSSGNVDIKMWYDPADQSALESDIVIGHWCDATCGTSKWDNWSKNNMTPGVEWNWDATNNWIQVLNIGTFSPLAPGRKAFPLPIELLSFNAECSNSTVDISWMTATETNNDFFTLERSCDSKDNYEIIGFVKGAGNSSEVNSYSYLDINFPGGECYYRLKQTDFDGRYEYFNIEPVNCNRTEGDLEFNLVASLPNPTKDLVFIFYTSDTEQKITVETFDVVGRLITSEITEARKGYNNPVVDLTKVSNGFYYINISNGQKHFIKKIVKRY